MTEFGRCLLPLVDWPWLQRSFCSLSCPMQLGSRFMCTLHDTQTYFSDIGKTSFLARSATFGHEWDRREMGVSRVWEVFAKKSGHSSPVAVQEFQEITSNFSPALEFQVWFATLFVAYQSVSVSTKKHFDISAVIQDKFQSNSRIWFWCNSYPLVSDMSFRFEFETRSSLTWTNEIRSVFNSLGVSSAPNFRVSH